MRKGGPFLEMKPAERHIKSRQRVADHGEVFTPAWLVDAMLDLVGDESERIDSRVLEPACGSGNFLVPVLRRKLTAVERKYGRSEFERRHYALLALMCTYGIEMLADNMAECRANLLETIAEYLGLVSTDEPTVPRRLSCRSEPGAWRRADDAHPDGQPIVFAEWGYLGRASSSAGTSASTRSRSLDVQRSGLAVRERERHELFTPAQTYPPMSVGRSPRRETTPAPGRRDDGDRPASRSAVATRTY